MGATANWATISRDESKFRNFIDLFDGFNEGEDNVVLSYLMLMAKFFILKYKLND